jgi:hypothetical protein
VIRDYKRKLKLATPIDKAILSHSDQKRRSLLLLYLTVNKDRRLMTTFPSVPYPYINRKQETEMPPELLSRGTHIRKLITVSLRSPPMFLKAKQDISYLLRREFHNSQTHTR